MSARLLVCDAGPLIIQAKLGVLTRWISELKYNPVLLDVVVDEIKRGSFAYGEQQEIAQFLKQAKIVSFPEGKDTASGLSLQDQASLSYVEKMSPAILLADDRLLRRAAKQAAVPVIGFPGLMIQAVRKNLVTKEEALKLLDKAIELHDYRISIALYQELRKQITACKT